ncbi:MAG: protein-ADP-ribose hydrolase, partial [Lachnospiraceae bacterium]|nr:protein-ADP-ribose hydrolase [Lachnospiraceae bacterium]
KYQGKGLGKQTIDAVMDLIRSFPFGEAKKVWLSYEPENTRAKGIYQKYGFVENGEMCGNEIVAVIDIGEKMTQEQRLDFLVEEFKADSYEYKDLQVPDDTDGKRRILRSLMNVRMPGKMDDAVLSVQDEYLQERIREKGIVRLQDIPVKRGCLSIWQGDITRLAVDAIVNAANSQMLGCFIPMHHCIDNCIHTFAGVQLRLECSRQMNQLRSKYGRNYEQPTAVPMLTDAYNLPSKKIVHIVGPILQYELTSELENDLADCYRNTLDLCLENGLKSVAFCCISTGVFHFPNKRAAEIAVSTVDSWLSEHPGAMERVIFNVFKDEDREYYESILR